MGECGYGGESLFECLEQVRRAEGIPFYAVTLLGLVCGTTMDICTGRRSASGFSQKPSTPRPISNPGRVPYEQLQGALTGWVARVVADQEVNASVDGKWAKQYANGNPLVMVNVLAHDRVSVAGSEKRYEPGVFSWPNCSSAIPA